MAVPSVYLSPVCEIPLTQGKVALIDAQDYALLSRYKWFYNDGYARAHVPGSGRGKNARCAKMHRLIMGNPRGFEVDHRNRDKLDNRRSNLRLATHADNQHNSGLRAANKTGYKGVCIRRQKRGIRYWARIIVNNKHINLGRYATAEEAALAYNEAAREYFGEFASLNEVAS